MRQLFSKIQPTTAQYQELRQVVQTAPGGHSVVSMQALTGLSAELVQRVMNMLRNQGLASRQAGVPPLWRPTALLLGEVQRGITLLRKGAAPAFVQAMAAREQSTDKALLDGLARAGATEQAYGITFPRLRAITGITWQTMNRHMNALLLAGKVQTWRKHPRSCYVYWWLTTTTDTTTEEA